MGVCCNQTVVAEFVQGQHPWQVMSLETNMFISSNTMLLKLGAIDVLSWCIKLFHYQTYCASVSMHHWKWLNTVQNTLNYIYMMYTCKLITFTCVLFICIKALPLTCSFEVRSCKTGLQAQSGVPTAPSPGYLTLHLMKVVWVKSFKVISLHKVICHHICCDH